MLEATKLYAAKYNLPDIYSHADANGADLIQFGMGRGLDYGEMLGLDIIRFAPALDTIVSTMPGGEFNLPQGDLSAKEIGGLQVMVMGYSDL